MKRPYKATQTWKRPHMAVKSERKTLSNDVVTLNIIFIDEHFLFANIFCSIWYVFCSIWSVFDREHLCTRSLFTHVSTPRITTKLILRTLCINARGQKRVDRRYFCTKNTVSKLPPITSWKNIGASI